MEEIKNLLEEEIAEEFHTLHSLKTGSEEKSTAIDDLVKLYKLKIDETKAKLEFDDKVKNHEHDEQVRKEQTSEQVKERYFRLGIAAAELILPLIFYAVWMNKGFKFEETGAYTSTTFRGLFNRFRPTNK